MGNLLVFPIFKRIKEVDRLSPTLVIIVLEVLERSLNNLFEDTMFKGYGMPKWNSKINHPSYADDTILFCSGIQV